MSSKSSESGSSVRSVRSPEDAMRLLQDAHGLSVASRRTSLLLHQVEHVAKGGLEFQGFLDFVGGHVRIFPIFQETRALVFTNELDERWNVRFPVFRKSFEVLKVVFTPNFVNRATASSVYLSKSVSKMPWYMK